jgi:hypothetical protein
MGSWGFKTLQDDAVLDWIGSFGRDPNISHIHSALYPVANAKDMAIGDLAAANALAAAEVVAAMNGNPCQLLPPQVLHWATQQGRPAPELEQLADAAVARVFTSSELRDIWEDSDGLDAWKREIDNLRARLCCFSGR